MTVLHRARRLVRLMGIDIARYPAGWSGHQLVQLMQAHHVDVVLDVGANSGEYGSMLRSSGYEGRIVSFEPLSAPAAELRRRASQDPWWTVLPYALGEESGTATINVAGNAGASSSLLPMLDRHADAAPHARYVATETAPLKRLDELWFDLTGSGERVFLKMDVQGYEAHVLRGAGGFAKDVVGIQIETSFVPLYEGGLLFAETLELVQQELDLTLMAVIPGFTDPGTGQMLQADLVLFREDAQR